MDYSYWALFLGAAVLLNLSPGPDLLFVLSKTFAGGRSVGIASSAGVCTGALVHVGAAALGISALLASSAMAFAFVKYMGAVYLVYLGIKNLRCAGQHFNFIDAKREEVSAWQAFKQGIMIDILNPKVALFFMAFLPQFVRPELASVSLQLFWLGLLVILIGFPIECVYVLLASKLSALLNGKRAMSKWLDVILGSVFIGLGVKLALYEKN